MTKVEMRREGQKDAPKRPIDRSLLYTYISLLGLAISTGLGVVTIPPAVDYSNKLQQPLYQGIRDLHTFIYTYESSPNALVQEYVAQSRESLAKYSAEDIKGYDILKQESNTRTLLVIGNFTAFVASGGLAALFGIDYAVRSLDGQVGGISHENKRRKQTGRKGRV